LRKVLEIPWKKHGNRRVLKIRWTKTMNKTGALFLAACGTMLCLPLSVHAETIDLGTFSFSMSSKPLKDGSITNIGAGYRYAETLSGSLRFRDTIVSKNEEIIGVEDSLNAVSENIFEVFLLPMEYCFFKNPNARAWLGGGLYYEYDKLSEKGFFNMPILENLNPPRERVNSYTNEFSMHVLGPLVDAGLSFNAEWFNIALSGGIVPVFFLAASQKMGMVPLLDPHYAEYSQNTGGSPYVYASLDAVLFKYVNIALLYDMASLKYRAIDFDEDLNWINPERQVLIQSFKIEASLLLPLGGEFHAQIGCGYTFDSMRLDAAIPVTSNRPYLSVAATTIGE
jgi:hypothetical protein